MKQIIKTKESFFLAMESIAERWEWKEPIVIWWSKSQRSTAQNGLMWELFTQLANRGKWYGEKYNKEEWKDILSAGFDKERKMCRGIDGGFVYFGLRTSEFDVSRMNEFLEYILWFAGEKPKPLEFDGFRDSPKHDFYQTLPEFAK